MKNFWKFFCVILIGFAWMHLAQGQTCSPANAEAADAMVDKLDSWSKVDYMFKHFRQCDDGSIAEGNSEAIARLLVDKWKTLPTLAKLIKQNPSLKMFVLRHIDTTLDTEDLKKIKKLSLSACPKNLYSLCKDVNRAVARAIQ